MWQSRIRNELKRLDAITGLQGANVPFTFFNRKNAFGMFVPGLGKMEFRFSKPLFEDPLLPDETKVDTIRHEYAHYMDYVQFGHCSHGPTWKRCCHTVGATPCKYYDETELKEAYSKRLNANRQMDLQFGTGTQITHPSFGVGKIVEVVGNDLQRIVRVKFADGICALSAKWLLENCK